MARARKGDEPWDVYLLFARTTPEGRLLSVEETHDLTRTSAASETSLVSGRAHAAWAIGDGSRYYRVELADLGGESLPPGEEWTRLSRFQRAVTNLQHTGQLAGVGRRSFKLDPAATKLALALAEDGLHIAADDHTIVVPWSRAAPLQGGRFLREDEREIARPGNLVTWAVDRARDLSWFGDERMQYTKAIAYSLLDRVDRLATRLGGASAAREKPAAEDLGELGAAAPETTDPEIGFPPPPIPPLVSPGFPDEGVWFSLDKDPFVHGNPGVPVPLVTTYVRGDGARPDTRVVVVAWDPRQVEMDAVPGTEEPQSATGETGTGMIPRRPEVMKRLLGAFNGAFQSTHGDYGMQVDGSLIVPPKPYAATIARLSDGAVGFGTWPYDLDVPKDLVSFRQNLTPLVMDGVFNPYGRQWWGGVPHDWEDETHTVRSGLCLTKEGFVLYFYGTKIDHEHLGRTMLAARCVYGVHLDMNQGHTGLELYRVFEKGALPPLEKLDGHFQTEGDVLDMPGYRFRGRRLVRNLQLMHFPRYIRRGARDYFYLLLRPVLPGAPLVPDAAPGAEGAWTTSGLPQRGFPHALATTSLRPDAARPETKVRVLKLDPSVLRAAKAGDATEPLLVVGERRDGRSATGTDVALYVDTRRAVIAKDAPSSSAVRVLAGMTEPRGPVASAFCVDDDGMLLFAEVATAADPPRDGALLAALLARASCRASLYLPSEPIVAIGGARDLSGHPVAVPDAAVRLFRDTTPRARRIFPETPVLPPARWMPLQRQTRIFPKEPEPSPSGSADSPPP
ncbi:MAG TPA: hypothetical protein VHE30_26630 [Polyangiaceae bacterium]|nr:hypothetical protein [Polyangiaceae bacterium]